jgi:hypothetical protein
MNPDGCFFREIEVEEVRERVLKTWKQLAAVERVRFVKDDGGHLHDLHA